MATIYYNSESKVGLYQCSDSDLPYVIKIGDKIIMYLDYIADAYREYNNTIRELTA